MQAGGFDIEDGLPAVGGVATGLLGDEGQGSGLVEQAELAFGRAPQVNPDLLYHSTQTPEQLAAANAKLKARLAAPPPAGGNVVLVGHSPTMKEAAAVELPEGQGAIVKPTGDGSFRIVARLNEAGITPLP